MSSIIKGQRIRSESKLEIENTIVYSAPEEVDEDLTIDPEEQKENINRKMQQAKLKANKIIEDAKEEAVAKAAVILNQAYDTLKRESAIALENAKEEGYQIGYEKGELEAQNLVNEGKQIVLDANVHKQQMLDDIEPQIIEMIIGICGKLLDDEINYNKDTILILIRKALGQVSSDILEISIKTSPDDYDHVLQNKDIIAKDIANPETMQIKRDGNLTKGVCVIETAFGSIECNINEAFSEITKQMRLICNKK